MEKRAGCDRAGDGKQWARQLWRKTVEKENAGDHSGGDCQSEQVDMSQRVYDFQKLRDGPSAVHRDPEHFAEYCDAHLKSDTGQKSKQDRLGKKIGEKAKPKNAPQEQQSSG
jgi:hypothetical protein